MRIALFHQNVIYISNGVKQDRCISPACFSVYLNGLLEKLRKNYYGLIFHFLSVAHYLIYHYVLYEYLDSPM